MKFDFENQILNYENRTNCLEKKKLKYDKVVLNEIMLLSSVEIIILIKWFLQYIEHSMIYQLSKSIIRQIKHWFDTIK